MALHRRSLEQEMSLHKRALEQDAHALVIQKTALDTQQKALEREQTLLQDSLERERTEMAKQLRQACEERERLEALLSTQLHREQRLNDDVRVHAQYIATETMRQNFFMQLEVLQHTNFSSVASNTSLQPGLLSMMTPTQPARTRGHPSNSSSSTTESSHLMLTSQSSGSSDLPSSIGTHDTQSHTNNTHTVCHTATLPLSGVKGAPRT